MDSISTNTQESGQKADYTAENIRVLAGREAVRARPGMYIGDTTIRGVHHIVYEAVDNSVDEALAGHCTRIIVTIHKNGSISVEDNGRGIPVDIHPREGISALTVVLTKLHAGGKFDKKTYKVSGGLHGVGISVTNFLSSTFEVWVKRNGKVYYQKFEQGIPIMGVEERGTSTETGTKVTFLPDKAIFPDITFNYDILTARIRELSYLNQGIEIDLNDERVDKNAVHKYDGGIKQFVDHLNKNKQVLHPVIYFTKKKDDFELEIAMQYTTSYQENIYTFANNINTHEGGTHLIGFKSALTRVINNYLKQSNGKNKNGKNKQKSEEDFSGEDVREGLTAIISVKIANPQFEGQTKTKLGNGEVAGIVNSLVVEGLSTYLDEHPADSRMIMSKCEEARRAREAARKAKELARKGVFEGGSLPGKLADCSNREPAKCELFIVEGDSAGGCFSADTKIALADGRNVSFVELIEEHNEGKEHYCYTIMDSGSIGIQKIKDPRKTKTNAEVLKVVLDNDEEIICTPDHLIMLKDGSYKRAKELTLYDSLMPLNRRISEIGGKITIKGYEMVYDPVRHWIFTHMLADEYNIRNKVYEMIEGSHRHHKDFDKRNNNPTNICRMTKEEHIAYHALLAEKNLFKAEVVERLKKLRQTPEFRERMRKIMLEMREELSMRAKAQWENEEYKKYMVHKFLSFYTSHSEYRKNSQERLREAQRKYWSSAENRRAHAEKTRNFFEQHPEAKKFLSESAQKQWKNNELRSWRSGKTKRQWTIDFRKKRKEAYDKTYYESTIKVLRAVYDKKDRVDIEEFENQRKIIKSRNILTYKTFFERFFNNDEQKLREAVENYNHKIKAIIPLAEAIDVYDMEVPGTHNFALASGVFVHNSAKQGRSREFQAILPLRGKILNVEKARLHKVFENTEIKAMIIAIGTGVKEDFNITGARYHKIVIATDADVDGSHIRTLLLTFLYRFMKGLIESGYVYIAQPPLYKIKRGKDVTYAYNDREKEEILKNGEAAVQRYKGLGEMNPEQLWETTMDPANRIIKQVVIQDAVEADRIFSLLMGEEVQPRRTFIMEHAKEVVNLDV